jgi:predicted nucleotidyltransferase
MSAATGTRSVGDRLDLLDALTYGDLFETAVTLDELHSYARVEVERDALIRLLAEDRIVRDVVVRRAGLLSFRGREHLLEVRVSGAERARRLERRARRVAWVLRHAPFVRGLALTGSVAAASASPDADVDLLVIVAPGRVGTVFLLLGTASRLLGRRLFCPNFYLAQDRLELDVRNVYVGRELVQARSLVGDVAALHAANPWLVEMFPNVARTLAGNPGLRPGSSFQRLLEAPLLGTFGAAVERRARKIALDRLRAHHGGPVPGAVLRELRSGAGLRFHRDGYDVTVPERYASRRDLVAAMLKAASERLDEAVREPSTASQAGRSS